MSPYGITRLLPGRTDRAMFVGMTGSGKTTLARKLLEFRPYVVVYDGKGTLNWSGYKRFTTLDRLADSDFPRLIYRPSPEAMRDEDALEAFFAWVYARGNTTLYVDEVYSVAVGNTLPFSYRACLTRGREHGIEVWNASQRPMFVPQEVLSEAEHLYAFRLRMAQDRKKVGEVCGIEPDLMQSLPKHHFYYSRQDSEPFGPLRLTL